MSLKFLPVGPMDKWSSVVQVMASHRPGDKPFPAPIMIKTPYDVIRWQSVKDIFVVSLKRGISNLQLSLSLILLEESAIN